MLEKAANPRLTWFLRVVSARLFRVTTNKTNPDKVCPTLHRAWHIYWKIFLEAVIQVSLNKHYSKSQEIISQIFHKH